MDETKEVLDGEGRFSKQRVLVGFQSLTGGPASTRKR